MAEENQDLKTTEEANTDNTTEISSNDEKIVEENPVNEDNTSNEENVEEFVKNSKKPLLKKVLIGLVSLLILVLLIGTILYFLGFFEQDTPAVEDKKKEVLQETKLENKEEPAKVMIKEKDTYNFDLKNINSKKLNEQLALLTNKSLNQEKIEAKEKIDNEKKIIEEEKKKKEEELRAEEELLNQEKMILESKKEELEKQKVELEALRKEALLLKEEMMNAKQELETKQDTQEEIIAQTDNNSQMQESIQKETKANEFVQLINVAKIKGELYKSYLDKITAINPDILLCRDDKNIIEIYLGPFMDIQKRSEVLNQLIENDIKESYEVELTQEEFNKRCKY